MGVLRLFTIFTALVICTSAQRPFYASGSHYPSVLPQNLPPNNSADVGNRFGENSTPDPYKEKDPVYNVEKELVDRIRDTYPKDKQPFWYVNAAQLNRFRQQQSVNTSRAG